ncbi:MAG: four helix bundle suffix domain-containing protein [Phycisphaerales bacterium]
MQSLIHQVNDLLDRQIKAAEADFVQKGGIRECMTAAGMNERNRKSWRSKRTSTKKAAALPSAQEGPLP